MLKKIDNVWLGLLLGLVIPPITLYIIFLSLTETLSLQEFVKNVVNWNLETNIYIWSVIPVFMIFSACYFLKLDKAAKGIVFPTMIYTFLLVILNF